MKTEIYKCIAYHRDKIALTIGKIYEVASKPDDIYNLFDDYGVKWILAIEDLNHSFQKVEPNNNKEMKYKVTINKIDHNGHEDVIVHENVSMDIIKYWLEDAQMSYKSILTEPMPEKKKVTVYAFVYMLDFEAISTSNVDRKVVERIRDEKIRRGKKVSEIFSKEVEI